MYNLSKKTMSKILKLHHSAYRCKDSEETRKFYEDFLGLELVKVIEIKITKTNRNTQVLHTFYQLKDGSCIAFFEDPLTSFNFKKQRDFDLHIALEVSESDLFRMYKKGINAKIETRGIIDHGFIQSIYFRDPNGYVVELTYPNKNIKNSSHLENLKVLKEWQIKKSKI